MNIGFPLRLLIVFSFSTMALPALAQGGDWQVLPTVRSQNKQDDIFFTNRHNGWYVNGQGFIYHTPDGGASWTPQLHQPGTYFRSINFSDESHGFAGNIGPDYFPGVTDDQPLYQTSDGGASWSAVKDVSGEDIKGVCALDSLKSKFINAGHLENRLTIYAAGRVGGPAKLVISRDGGQNWKKYDLSKYTAMIQDVKFLNESTGFICAGSDPDVAQSHAQILKTNDGGTTWKTVFMSQHPMEVTWKCNFPSERVGYATVLNFDTDLAQKVVAKTVDGGETWQEIPLALGGEIQEFGVGFLDENIGWVGAMDGVWNTTDGGQSWTHQKVGHAINKIRIVSDTEGTSVFGIGLEVIKLDLPSPLMSRGPLSH